MKYAEEHCLGRLGEAYVILGNVNLHWNNVVAARHPLSAIGAVVS